MYLRVALVAAFAAGALACTPPASEAPSEPAPIAESVSLPDGAGEVVLAAMPGVTITASEQQDAANGGELEVTAVTADGLEYEFDLMPGEAGAWNVVQIQRDIAWEDAPENVRTVAAAAPGAFTPVRVIESREPVDGAVYYQLFSATDQPQFPSVQVRLYEGEAAVMPPAH